MMMDGQRWATPQRGLPVEDTGGSSARLSVSGETVAFYYSNSGTRTVDAGQAAATVVEAVLANGPIANSSGTEVATYLNSSLSFTSTAFTTEIKLSWKDLESLDGLSFAQRLSAVQTLVAAVKTAAANNVPTTMSNGDYVVDYRKGALYGKKASTQTTLTSAAYVVLQKGGSPAITSIIPGTGATNLGKAEDAAFTTGDTGVMALGVANEAGSNLSGTDGDYTPIRTNRAGTVYNQDTTAPVYENNTTGKAIVEKNYSTTRVTADGQIKASAGFVSHISFAATGTVTAGTITLYNNTAESGTVLWSGIIQVGTAPVTVPINADATLGIYVGYDGTVANVATHVSWR